jgi:NADH-quinone oxidoreductase subunit N
MTSADFQTVLPEIVLAVYAMAALMFGVYTTKDKAAPLLVWVDGGVFVLLALWIGCSGRGERVAFGGMFVDDPSPALPR